MEHADPAGTARPATSAPGETTTTDPDDTTTTELGATTTTEPGATTTTEPSQTTTTQPGAPSTTKKPGVGTTIAPPTTTTAPPPADGCSAGTTYSDSSGDPILPARACQFTIPRSTWTTIVTDNVLVRGWSDPDHTAAWLCIHLEPVNPQTWGADGADCEGKGLRIYADHPGTYYMDYRVKECQSDVQCRGPYSKQQNRITIRVR